MFLVPVSRRAPVPSRSFDRLFDDTLFDRFLNSVTRFDAPATRGLATRSPALSLRETDRAYTVTLDMPGVAKSDIKVTIEGRRVDISTQTAQADEKKDARQDEQKDGDRLLYSERATASYARSVTLPVEVDQAASSAALDNGVLTLTLAKKLPASTQLPVR